MTMNKKQIAACAMVLAAISLGIQQVTRANLAGEAPDIQQQAATTPRVPPTERMQAPPPQVDLPAEPRQELRRIGNDLAELEAGLDAAAVLKLRFEQAKARSKARVLAARLGLDEDRSALVERRALLNVAREQERFAGLMRALSNAKGSLAEIGRVSSASGEIGLFDGIEHDLDEAQQERYEEWRSNEEEAESLNLVESETYQHMEDLQTTLRLTEEKRANAFEILWGESEAIFLGPDEEPLDPGTDEPFRRNIEQRLKERLQRLSDVFNEEELHIYRQHLEDENGMELQ